MHKQDLIDAVRQQSGWMRESDARATVDLFFGEDGVIARALAAGDSVVITGFGTFTPRGHYATTIPNPDGEPISVPSWRGVTFRTGDALRRAVQYDVRVFPVHR